MKKASITEVKNNLSALIDGVKGGSPVLIVDRGRPVARLEPVSGVRPDDDSRLARLVREGVVRPARAAMSKAVFTTRPPRLTSGASGVRALLDERREGR
jgi:prevent-host-death family protein